MPAYSGTRPILDALSQGLAGRRVILSGSDARTWPGLESPDAFWAGAILHEWLQAVETSDVRARARAIAEAVGAEDGTGAAVAALEQLVAPPARA